MTTSKNRGDGDGWGPWVLHDGKGCPVRPGTLVEVVFEDRFGFSMRQTSIVSGGRYSSWDWSHYPELKRILRYRERKATSFEATEEEMFMLDTSEKVQAFAY
ncbi:hypothetical protein [Celeribacter litoreus]|uniref:hypothetical protein n=1 Tax=Celeribacter litoreus TaxID=2876714 RepID=UPI001CCA8C1F|nr:hypothetical protein [Celeribacter litoreus]MCA0044677.1 hypothetical protein [Celeribacter litoreus]